MPDLRFFQKRVERIPLSDAAALCGGVLKDPPEEGAAVADICPVSAPVSGAAAYLEKGDAAQLAGLSALAVCILPPDLAASAPAGLPVIVSKAPRAAFARLAAALWEARPIDNADAFVSPDAVIEPGARIGVGAVIAADAQIGAESVIGPNAIIGPGVQIGRGCDIGAGAVVTHTLMGNGVRLLPGAKVGQDGFGFAQDGAQLVPVPQLGRVILQDLVEIGANATIDRGMLDDTVIGEATKIDNLVQIGHNVKIGRMCVLAAHTGISGSCDIGDYAMFGGKAGLADHVKIGTGAQVAAGSGVMRDIPPGEKWGGLPAQPIKNWLRQTALLNTLMKKSGKK